jgi:hypothetical protein
VTRSPVERYLRLGLQLERHSEGIIDAYFGPPELAAAIDAEPPAEPGMLLSDAEALLDELEDGWLRDQVIALRTCAAVLAGELDSYADEVEGYYGVRPSHTDESVFVAAHEELARLLPEGGTLAERYQAWERSNLVPADDIERLMAAVIEEARGWTNRLVTLPEGELVILETVHDKPWWASCDYLGGLRSRIRLNVDLPMSAFELLVLSIHETYPGHHTERSVKESLLVQGRGMLEETMVVTPSPQTLVAEGIAALAPNVLLEGETGRALVSILHDADLELDLPHALAVRKAHEPCRWAEVNAALMLHERKRSEAEAHSYLEQWCLEAPEWTAHLVRFMTAPSQRSYIITYSAGRELCRAFVAGDRKRFRSLLSEQVRVCDLHEQRGVEPPGRSGTNG